MAQQTTSTTNGGASAGAAKPRAKPTAPGVRSTPKRKRKERERFAPDEAQAPAKTPATSQQATTQNQSHLQGKQRASTPRSGPGGSTSSSLGAAAASDTAAGTGGALTPRSRAGRWTRERYDAAQRSLVHILRLMGATSPHKAILRPSLREEARKVIGDTGLLDHLLKHLADQVVSGEGERLRRRHNREGHMEYWLQNPQAAEEGAWLKGYYNPAMGCAKKGERRRAKQRFHQLRWTV